MGRTALPRDVSHATDHPRRQGTPGPYRVGRRPGGDGRRPGLDSCWTGAQPEDPRDAPAHPIQQDRVSQRCCGRLEDIASSTFQQSQHDAEHMTDPTQRGVTRGLTEACRGLDLGAHRRKVTERGHQQCRVTGSLRPREPGRVTCLLESAAGRLDGRTGSNDVPSVDPRVVQVEPRSSLLGSVPKTLGQGAPLLVGGERRCQ